MPPEERSADAVRTGRCFCGGVRFETRGAPKFISNCHCETCRRMSSAPSVTWAGFRDEQVSLSGDALAAYASSPGVQRFFCRNCGAQIAFRGEEWAGETHLTVCSFEDAAAMAPTSDHFAEEKLPWAALLGKAHAAS
jgi:hypothetical protein